jgi:hypothetical protein
MGKSEAFGVKQEPAGFGLERRAGVKTIAEDWMAK